LDGPSAITSDGTHVWVANGAGDSVTELSASTGALVKVISDSSYGLDGPDAVTSDGNHIWVANGGGQSVTEFSAS
jgi:DNA-binding beta-propeller fold protein YncE